MSYLRTLVLSSFLLAHSQTSSQERQLTRDGLLKRDPVYTVDGQSVIYSVRASSPRLVLMRLDLKTGKTTRLHPRSNLVEFRPTYSANGNFLAFHRMTGNDVCSLYVETRQPKAERKIKTGKNTSYNATISNDGTALLYNLSGQLYELNLKTGKETPFAHASGRSDWPRFSPDDKKVLFASSRRRDFDLFIADRDGNNVRRLTTAKGMDIRPAWSPDGRLIIFTSNRDKNYEIYLTSVEQKSVHRITTNPERDDYASWHPDGKRFVYVSERNGKFDLFERMIDQ